MRRPFKAARVGHPLASSFCAAAPFLEAGREDAFGKAALAWAALARQRRATERLVALSDVDHRDHDRHDRRERQREVLPLGVPIERGGHAADKEDCRISEAAPRPSAQRAAGPV